MKTGALILLIAVGTSTSFAQIITSNFAVNADGWTSNGASNVTNWTTPGYISATDYNIVGAAVVPVYWTFIAPAKFTGNKSIYYDGTLTFDLQQAVTRPVVQTVADIQLSSGTTTVYYFSLSPGYPAAAPGWTTYSIPLNELSGHWKTSNSSTGTAATASDIQFALTNLISLKIRGRYGAAIAAGNSGSLDNVILTPFVITTQPAATQTVCSGANVSLTTAATGNPSITYQWQVMGVAGGFGNLANNAVFSGVQTSSLSITTSISSGAGTYRCKISGTAAADLFTSNSVVKVNATPPAPATTPGNGCSPASVGLSAAGGGTGEYRWYDAATGGSLLTGGTNGTFTTPSLTATASYFVSVNNGTCESPRTAVIATVYPTPAAPGVSGGNTCVSGAVTLTATGGADGQYRWYTVAGGGNPLAAAVNHSYVTPVLNTTTTYYVAINNGNCEGARTAVVATIAPTCDKPPAIEPVSPQAQIGGKVTIRLDTLVTDPDGNQNLSTLAVYRQPASGALASIVPTYELVVDYSLVSSFSGKDSLVLQVCDTTGLCALRTIFIEVAGDITVYAGFSPNGDKHNPFFFIRYIDALESTRLNHVTIFNRWGDNVFETDNYDNVKSVFNGVSKSGAELPTGTYFYKIDFTSGRKSLTGYISLKR